MNCPKCGSEKISITSDEKDPTPMYKCAKCGYKGRLFPKFESDKNVTDEEADEDELGEDEDEEESTEDEETTQF
ncbi:MAG: hypothetical protein ABSG05_00085 [Candidatus Pacearchaeota archaeon]